MRKCYQVFYITKRNKKEEINHIYVTGNNSKEACKKCKEIVLEQTGRNAFRPTTNISNLIK